MSYRTPNLPVETLEHIIWLIPDTNDAEERRYCKHRPTFLACALVCKTWMSFARCRLLSLYFPEGEIKITSEPKNILKLVDTLQSPLCTLNPTFIRVLCCTLSKNLLPYEIDANHELFFMVLSVINASLFPSLQKIVLDHLLFPERSSRHFTASSKSVLFRIKSLVISPPPSPFFKNIIQTVRLCPSVKELRLEAGRIHELPFRLYQELPPPKSLRKLVLDVTALCEVAKWLTLCRPAHTRISSLTITDFCWTEGSLDYDMFLDQIGSNLKELVLEIVDWEEPGDFVIDDPDEPIDRFTKNVQLKRLTLEGPPDVVVVLAAYLVKQVRFAPELEILNLTFREFYDEEIPHLIKFKSLDDNVHTRPSLRQIVISSTEVETWEDVKSDTRKYLPRCEEKGILELKLCS